jgi:hypothetical protein
MAERIGGIEAVVTMDVSQLQSSANIAEQAVNKVAIATTKVDAAAKTGAKGITDFGSRMMIVGQFADDVQYGLRAVVNQIPQMAMAFGMGAGLAGSLSVLAVIANQVVNRWDDITASFSTSTPIVTAQAQEMANLAEKTNKTAEEAERLNKLQKEQKDIAAQKASMPDANREAGAESGKVIANAPYDVIRRVIADHLKQNAIGARVSDKDLQLELDRLRISGEKAIGISDEDKEKIRERMQDVRDKVANESAERLINNLQNGTPTEQAKARQQLDWMGQTDENIKPFADKIRASSPEEQNRIAQLRLEASGSRQGRLIEQRMERERIEREKAQRLRDLEFPLEQQDFEASEANKLHDRMMDDNKVKLDREDEPTLEKNKKAWKQFDQGVDKFKALDERQMSLRQRLIENNRDNSGSGVGQSMGLDEYESSIKSEGQGRMEAKQEETNRILKEIQKGWQQYKVIAVEQRGG